MSAVLTVFVIALAASAVGAITGLGGALLARPLLESLGVVPSLSLHFLMVVMVLFTALSRLAFRSFRGVDYGVSLLLVAGSLLGGAAGSASVGLLFGFLSSPVAVSLQLGLVIVLNLVLMGSMYRRSLYQGVLHRHPAFLVLVGLGLGFTASFLGIGGGALNLMVLFYFFHFTPKHAALNSLFIILCSQGASLVLALGSSSLPSLSWQQVAAVAAAGVLGGFLGHHLSRRLSESLVRSLLAGVLVLVCILDLTTILQLLLYRS